MSNYSSAQAQLGTSAQRIVSEDLFGDRFTSEKLKRLDAIRDDREIGDGAFRMAHHIAKYVNSKSGIAFPGRELLAELLGVDIRTVTRYRNALVARGHLVVVEAQGRSVHCAFVAVRSDYVDVDAPTMGDTGVPNSCGHGTLNAPIGDTGVPLTTFIELQKREEKKSAGTASLRDEADNPVGFSRFWQAYPKKAGMDLAIAFYRKAIEAGVDPSAIHDGAVRYAAARAGEDDRFTKYASNWLREESWTEEPKPQRARSSTGKPASSHVSTFEYVTALAGLCREETN